MMIGNLHRSFIRIKYEPTIEGLGRLGACSAVVDAMAKFPTDQDVQWRGCGAVAYLADNHTANQVGV